MTYFLKKPWTSPRDNSVRIYIDGTTRSALYLTFNGTKLVWSSKTNDTPPKFRTGDHYGKINKDSRAAYEACEAFGLVLGGGADQWERALEIAASGVGYDTTETDTADEEAA